MGRITDSIPLGNSAALRSCLERVEDLADSWSTVSDKQYDKMVKQLREAITPEWDED